MKRRDFLKAGLAAGAAAVVAPRTEAKRPVGPFELDEATVADLQKAMAEGRETSKSICEKYLARIEEVDKDGPAVNSVIETNPDALRDAEAFDHQRSRGRVYGPLHGIPVLLKDNIETAGKMQTTAGSLVMQGNYAAKDAFIVGRLRNAGAVILGKTNLSEWANFRSTHSTSGWSGRGGQTKNPYALDRNPCGSSSGSGVAASANLAALTIGTETDGSIVCPSTSNGIVGIKPTLGLVSRSGIIPLAHSQDTAGPMCRTVRDAVLLLDAITGKDPNDPAARDYKGSGYYVQHLNADGLKGRRIGVGRQFFGFNPAVDAVMEEAIRAMREAGAEIVDPVDMATRGQYDDGEWQVLLYEFKADINKYLASNDKVPHRSLKDLIEANIAMKDREMPFFGQEIFELAQEKGPLTEMAYRKALAKNHQLSQEEGIDAALAKHRVDAIVAPTGGPAWVTDPINGDHFSGGSSTPAAVSGYPAVTVPAGFVRGLPVGITFFGRAWSEATLIKFAYAFEQATKARKAPRFLTTVELRAEE
jgi:amidase